MKNKQYDDLKRKAREREASIVRAGQDIAPLPDVVDQERKDAARLSFRAFCKSYFSDVFYLPWSPIHVDVANKIERVILNGESFALAMPRGTGKTTLSLIAVLWAALYGHSRYVSLIAASAERARALLDDLKTWLEVSDSLLEDFPEVCYPARKLERITHRQKGQRYLGTPTRIEWGALRVVLPSIDGSPASGCVIQCSGLAGSQIRGLSFVRADGKRVRPDLCIVDDPQTRESALSPKQCDDRERVIKADVLGMAGPGKSISCLVCITVVAQDDLAERLLDRKRNPHFRGERYSLLQSEPKRLDLWDEYRGILNAELMNDGDGSQATAYYAARRDEMDEGAVSSWPERMEPGEVSAIQYAMNLRFRDEGAFLSEYQNTPAVEEKEIADLEAHEIAAKVNGLKQDAAPAEAAKLVAFIDVHKDLLYYVVTAFEDNFTGYIVEYGTFPKQRRRYFKLKNAKPTLGDAHPGSVESSVYDGLNDLVNQLAELSVPKNDGVDAAPLLVQKILIDANWGQTTDVVYKFCRQSAHSRIITPSHGVYVGAAGRPFGDMQKRRGDVVGPHWRSPNEAKRGVRHVLVDTNYWKSFVMERLSSSLGAVGSLSFYGKAREHQLISEHFKAETRVPVEAKGRRVDEWKQVPQQDNHFFDCAVGCAVAASMIGCALPTMEKVEKKERRRVSFAELQRLKKES